MRLYFLVVLLLLVVTGCNSDPRCRRETALLRAEILDLEDKYYIIKSERDNAVAQLQVENGTASVQSGEVIYENDPIYGDPIYHSQYYPEGEIVHSEVMPNEMAPRSISATEGLPVDAGDAMSTRESAPFDLNPNSSDTQPRSLLDSADEDILPFETDDEVVPDNGAPAAMLNGPSPPRNRASARQRNNQLQQVSSLKMNSKITEITINPGESFGSDTDGVPGDEALILLIQPKNANGQVVLQPAAMTVSVLDPSQADEQQRVGLWKFVAKETKLFFENKPQSKGIRLELDWNHANPVGDEVVVFVRYLSRDGEKLETSQRIKIDSGAQPDDSDDLIANWRDRQSASELGGDRTASENTRKTVPAIPASTGGIKKPAWRPVR